MIYLTIPAESVDDANKWMKETFHEGNDTFVVNKKDDSGNEYCLISLPDNNYPFNQAMITQFGVYTVDPRKIEINTPAKLTVSKSTGKLETAAQQLSTKIIMSDITIGVGSIGGKI